MKKHDEKKELNHSLATNHFESNSFFISIGWKIQS